jgi:cyclopropane-fatty-acyl-phospholipid synthase
MKVKYLDDLYNYLLSLGISLMEKGYVPDHVIRYFSRSLIAQTLSECSDGGTEKEIDRLNSMVKQLKAMPIAINTADANEQHYEVPTEFFLKCLGPHLKYSCCLYPKANTSLGEAEEAMLETYLEKSGVEDGMRILDLGCGWGSLSLFLAQRLPNAKVTSLSNSATQRDHIMGQAKERGITNLQVFTGDIRSFDTFEPSSFDRIFSIEMFEHMKNYELLLEKLSKWLKPGGKLFVHIFSHMKHSYHYEVKSEGDWMTKYFFQGGTMPSHDLLLHFQKDLAIEKTWRLNGKHYAKTSRDWLRLMDQHKESILTRFAEPAAYGKEAYRWFVRWRVFYIAVEEFFAFKNGEEWGVSMYLFNK